MPVGKADASGWAEQENFRIRFMLLLPPGIRKKLFREQQRSQLGLKLIKPLPACAGRGFIGCLNTKGGLAFSLSALAGKKRAFDLLH